MKSILVKLKALADGTDFENEKTAALKKLGHLMQKHGITEADLEDDAISTYEFKCHGRQEERLLAQVLYKVFGSRDFEIYTLRRRGRKIPNTIGVDCTIGQKVEIDLLFDFYKELFNREIEAFFQAFIQKHQIFGTSTAEPKEISEEETLKMLQLMRGISDESPHKRLPSETS